MLSLKNIITAVIGGIVLGSAYTVTKNWEDFKEISEGLWVATKAHRKHHYNREFRRIVRDETLTDEEKINQVMAVHHAMWNDIDKEFFGE